MQSTAAPSAMAISIASPVSPGLALVHSAEVGWGWKRARIEALREKPPTFISTPSLACTRTTPVAALNGDAGDAVALGDELDQRRLGPDRQLLAQRDLQHAALDRRARPGQALAGELAFDDAPYQRQCLLLAAPGALGQHQVRELVGRHGQAEALVAREFRLPLAQLARIEQLGQQRPAARLAARQLVVVVGPAVGIDELHALPFEEVDHLRAGADEGVAPCRRGARAVVVDRRVQVLSRALGLSLTPARFITGLSGTHQTPPEKPVEPPTRACFSTISARLPSVLAASAAHIEPPPLPTIDRS